MNAEPSNDPVPAAFTPIGTITLSLFSDLIADAAERVHRKTDKAIDSARRRYADDAAGWDAWVAVFAREQLHYSTETLSPILTTYRKLSGNSIDGMAMRIGGRYAQELAQHLHAIAGDTNATAPDLTTITLGDFQ